MNLDPKACEDSVKEKNLETLKRRLEFSDANDFLASPRYLTIETVNTCNARCIMCSIHDWQRKVEIMKDDMWDLILKRVTPIASGVRMVALYNEGEPLIDKKIAPRIASLKKLGVKKINITSNGSLNTPARNLELLESGLDEIRFTVDGFSKPVYEEIRVRLDRDVVYNNILDLIEQRNRLGKKLAIRLQMVVQPKNIHEFEQWAIFWMSKLNLNDGDRVIGNKLHNWGSQLQLNGANLLNSEQEPCISLWGSMYVHVDGTVAMCCCDYNGKHRFGDLKTQTIEEVWQNSPMLLKYRESHLSGKRNEIPMCVGCTAWSENKQHMGMPKVDAEVSAVL